MRKKNEVTRAAHHICLIKEENSSCGGCTLQISVHCFQEKTERANGDWMYQEEKHKLISYCGTFILGQCLLVKVSVAALSDLRQQGADRLV